MKIPINQIFILFVAASIPIHTCLADSPSAGATSTGGLNRDVRSALARTVEFFKKRAAEDEEGWMVPPTRTRKVVDHEVVTYRYREVMIEHPVFEYEYETYEVIQKVRVGESVEAVDTYRKVKMRRVVSRKQTGVKKVKRLVRDPNGSITREHRIPKYGPGGPDVWPRYALGDNALALYALRRAGVSADDVTVNKLVTNLDNFLSHFGYPDETWDLAWLTAAYSTLPYESHRKRGRILASKLLDGQIRDGDAAGLWGPVAINTALLAERVLEVEKLSAKFKETKKEAAQGKREQRAFQEADTAYRAALDSLMRVATSGMAGHTIEMALSLQDESGTSVRLAGLSDYIYNQRTADLGCTALALYALRQAAENGTFPEELWRPESSRAAKSPSKLLSASMNVLAKKLVEKHGWDEMNHYQAVKDFDKVGIFPGLPRADVPFPKLSSKTTLLTTIQGFSAMADAARIAKSDALNTKYRKHLAKGSELFRSSAENLLKNGTPKQLRPVQFAPYDHYLFLSEVTREPNSTKEDRRDLWEPLANGLLSTRSANGGWEHRGPGRRYHFPTSLLARLAVMEDPKKKKNIALIEYDKPHAYRVYHSTAALLRSDRKLPVTVEDVVPTSFAMVFLAENVRPPMIGECLWTAGSKGSRLAPLVISVMRQQKKLPVRYSTVLRPVKTEHLSELPVLLIRGDGNFDPNDQENKALQDYLNTGGLVLFEAVADSDGTKFLSGAERALKALLPDSSTLEDVGSDKDLMGSAVGKANIRAFRKPNGSLAAVFLPLAPKSGAKGLPRSTAARAVYNMLFQKINPEMLEENYPSSVSAADNHDDTKE
jgi:hypothetical protein